MREKDVMRVRAWVRVPPGNRLEKLAGNRAGRHSIRVNDQRRVCFRRRDGDAEDVEIVA
jgi:proteic killer suppression protein